MYECVTRKKLQTWKQSEANSAVTHTHIHMFTNSVVNMPPSIPFMPLRLSTTHTHSHTPVRCTTSGAVLAHRSLGPNGCERGLSRHLPLHSCFASLTYLHNLHCCCWTTFLQLISVSSHTPKLFRPYFPALCFVCLPLMRECMYLHTQKFFSVCVLVCVYMWTPTSKFCTADSFAVSYVSFWVFVCMYGCVAVRLSACVSAVWGFTAFVDELEDGR